MSGSWKADRPAVAQYRAAAEAGLTMAEAACVLGVHYDTVRWRKRQHGIEFQSGESGPRRRDDLDLTAEQRAFYEAFRRNGRTREEALSSIVDAS